MDVDDNLLPGVALLRDAKFCIGGPEPLEGERKFENWKGQAVVSNGVEETVSAQECRCIADCSCTTLF
ncbi:hypothetical protein BOTBODRAFT_33918 [Botryobasidium botryosum FD-172 SS1]|uniref:Uncharacterized protein n=1 Tax=Botryobasidium botryosum (strain FD-172 SS1) TaxID=930990 RepID=A0A067MB90_BOTB1|nr:hypothetical protein BOTBODRAFT_33918 [Botryobasidium botryosum FD-172 SS1]